MAQQLKITKVTLIVLCNETILVREAAKPTDSFIFHANENRCVVCPSTPLPLVWLSLQGAKVSTLEEVAAKLH